MTELSDEYTALSVIGQSHSDGTETIAGVDILALDLLPRSEKIGQIFIVSGHHPSERASLMASLEFVSRLKSNPAYQRSELGLHYQITVIPIVDVSQADANVFHLHDLINTDYEALSRSESQAVASVVTSRTIGLTNFLAIDLHEHQYHASPTSFFLIPAAQDYQSARELGKVAINRVRQNGHNIFPDTDYPFFHAKAKMEDGMLEYELPNFSSFVAKHGGTAFVIESPEKGDFEKRVQMQLIALDTLIYTFIANQEQ